jgi:hypothetical protein
MTAPDERLRVWLETSAVEDQHFDIKQTLDLTSESQRKELLKDLTGMGNGGGGTVAFGVAERVVGSESVADHVVPLTDRALLGRLRDTIANAVRPTLRWHAGVVEHPGGGYVLIVDVEPSPLGPYMVDAYKGPPVLEARPDEHAADGRAHGPRPLRRGDPVGVPPEPALVRARATAPLDLVDSTLADRQRDPRAHRG